MLKEIVPGYASQRQMLAYLGMTRQNFYQAGLDKIIAPDGQAGRSYLYPVDEIEELAEALNRRRGLIALGLWRSDTPLREAPRDDEIVIYDAAPENLTGGDLDHKVNIEVDGNPRVVYCVCPPGGETMWCPVRGVIPVG